MFARSFLFALLALALAAPAARADTIGDGFVPDYGAADGVYVRTGPNGVPYMVFGTKAAKLYKGLAGQRATVACGRVTPSGSGSILSTSIGESTMTLPRRRGQRIPLLDDSSGAEICAIATRKAKADRICLPLDSTERKECTRVAVALTDSGRAYIDQKKRTFEIFSVNIGLSFIGDGEAPTAEQVAKFYRGYVVALDGPDASPPPGKVGYWFGATADEGVIASLLGDGSRAFMSMRAGVYSTNLPGLMGPSDEAAALF